MAKLSNPFHSFSARGSIGRVLSVRRRLKEHIAQDFPDHPDANTTPQQAQRLMFQMCRDLWHTLSQGEKAAWESLARPFHMTGYAYYLSQCLRPNPGIYLPLAGGTMQGAINMATNRITDLPSPGANSDPARKQEIINHAALTSGVHGLLGCPYFYAYLSSNQLINPSTYTKVAFDSCLYNNLSGFDTTSNHFKPTIPGAYLVYLFVRWAYLPTGTYTEPLVRRNTGTLQYGLHGDSSIDTNPVIFSQALFYLNGTVDYAYAYIYHNDSSARYIMSGISRTTLMGFLISQTA